jgi:CRP/FNR family transcriptional regulator
MSETIVPEFGQSNFNHGISTPRGGIGERSRLADLLQLMGVGLDDQRSAPDIPLSMRRLRTGDTLFYQGARAEAIYFVRGGTFKSFRIAEDGYEQVLGFSGRSEVLGFDAICMGHYPTASVALEEASVYVLPMHDILTPGQRVAALDRVVTMAVSRALSQRGELADVMAAVAAEVRLARFLVQLSRRMEACGQSPRRFRLRMGRRDIASHLGVAHETVSRSFHALVKWSLLHVSNREVEIIDMKGLLALSRSTRRHVEEFGISSIDSHAQGPSAVNQRANDRQAA